MNAEERIAELEAKVAELLAEKVAWQGEAKELREQLAQALVQIGQLLARVHELEGRVAKDSHSSSKPLSSDGLAHKTRSQRDASGKKSGGQPGHEGHHLKLVETPDEVMRHRPRRCSQCQQSLEGVEGEVVERRQVQDLPPVRLLVAEHQVEEVGCLHCQQMSRGSFPEGVSAPAQYGAGVKALTVYLHQYQLVSMERTVEVLQDVCGCRISEGTVVSWEQEAASRLEPTVEQIAERVAHSRLQHADETGIRLGSKLHWIHVNSTRFLTHLAWHAKRDRAALEAIGIWPRFTGRAMHDRWKSYDGYTCAHSVCCAHLVRELTFLAEHDHQEWAADLKDLLLSMHAAAQQWREQGASCVPPEERNAWVAQYFEILTHGYATQPLPPGQAPPPRKKGRPKQSAAKDLLDDLLRRADQVLAFLDDLCIPFTKGNVPISVEVKLRDAFRVIASTTASAEAELERS